MIAASERSFARRIDLTSLQLFVAVCELGSIGRAAEREYIAASAISKRLSDLEAALCTPLLYRHTRGVDLTPAGQSLLHHARSVLYSLEKMQGELSEYADGVRGHVRVHANISAIVQFLPEDLGAFRRDHEAIKIDLEEHLSAEVLRAVQEGAADLGICHLADGAGELQSLAYRQDHLVLIVPIGHTLADRCEVAFVESLDHDHVGLHRESSIYAALRDEARRLGRPLRLRMHVPSFDAICRMAQVGMGLGVVPQGVHALLGPQMNLVAVPLTDPWARRTLTLVVRPGPLSPAASLLLDHLHAAS